MRINATQNVKAARLVSCRSFSKSGHVKYAVAAKQPLFESDEGQVDAVRQNHVVRNEAGVQLLSPFMHKQVYGHQALPSLDPRAIAISKSHLDRHGLAKKESPVLQTPDFVLPKLQGTNIEEHFYNLGLANSAPYLSIARDFADATLPRQPDVWQQCSGWVRYEQDGSFEPIDYPPDDTLVFDVETLYKISPYAVMATAASKSHWYSWTSPWLLGETDDVVQLIPFPGERPALLVGHNVGYDRARIREEYNLEQTRNRFLDTMSLHVAVRGLSSHQRVPWMLHRKTKRLQQESGDPDYNKNKGMWQDLTSLNSLADVAKLYCGLEVDKSARDWFSTEDKQVIVDQFQELMSYCAGDVVVTHQVFKVVLPAFMQACPHPVTFAGILQMGNSFLPVDESWTKFLDEAEGLYQQLTKNAETELHKLADQARKLIFVKDENGRFVHETDPWLRQLDWTPKKARKSRDQYSDDAARTDVAPSVPASKKTEISPLKGDIETSKSTGIPAWYKTLLSSRTGEINKKGWDQVVPLLLKMTWNGYPLHNHSEYGWYYAVPVTTELPEEFDNRLDVSPLGDAYACYAPAAVVKRTIFNTKSLLHFENGHLNSPYRVAKVLCKQAVSSSSSTGNGTSSFQRSVLKIAKAALKNSQAVIAADSWLSQLDWSGSAIANQREEMSVKDKGLDSSPDDFGGRDGVDIVSPASSVLGSDKKVSPERTIDITDQVWPQWFWHICRPRAGEEGMDLSIRSKAAPLLLRLRWQGHELAHSRAHGWLYRVPLRQVSSSDSESVAQTPLSFELSADLGLQEDVDHVYYKLPHKDGADSNVGTPLSKTFVSAFEDGVLSSEYPAAAAALEMNAQCSYWISARERVINQLVVWENQKGERGFPLDSDNEKQGIILPQVVTMGTVTRRAVESTWLAASNAKKNRLGSELKAMIRAPPGYAIVGADVDSEELWICSVMGDAQFGIHGATAIGWMTLEGTKSAGTDLHSKTASILNISRDKAKVFNYSRIYGAGVKHAVQLLMQANQNLKEDVATDLAKALYASTKGLKQHTIKNAFDRKFWHGGTESHLFNTLEAVAMAPDPRTPALGCGITAALAKKNLPKTEKHKAGEDFMPSRINWVVQSSGVDYLHLLIVSMEYLCRRFDIKARFMISVHDEIRYLVKAEDQYRAALALQISNLWTRALFSYRLQVESLPQSCAFFSAVDLDHVLRKEVNMDCVTPSQRTPIPHGQAQQIEQTLRFTNQGSLFFDGRSMSEEANLPSLDLPPNRMTYTPTAIEYRKTSPKDIGFLDAQNCSSKVDLQALMEQQRDDNASLDWDIAKHEQRETSSVRRNENKSLRVTKVSHGPITTIPFRRAPEGRTRAQ